MKTIRELLRDADPLGQESAWPEHERDRRRQAVVASASHVTTPAAAWLRPQMAIFAIVALALIATFIVGSFIWTRASVDLQAAVLFEVRLAEDSPGAGLREARVFGSNRAVYLHEEVIVTNSDIAQARIVQGDGPSRFSVGVELNTAGAERMRAATENHVGKPVAILIDGVVVAAPVVRSSISTSGVITGDFTRAEADRIVNGI